jgi:hypothetical protein
MIVQLFGDYFWLCYRILYPAQSLISTFAAKFVSIVGLGIDSHVAGAKRFEKLLSEMARIYFQFWRFSVFSFGKWLFALEALDRGFVGDALFVLRVVRLSHGNFGIKKRQCPILHTAASLLTLRVRWFCLLG